MDHPVISKSLTACLDACVLVPPLAARVLEHGHVDDLQHGRPLDLRHQELDQRPRHVVGHERAPTRHIAESKGCSARLVPLALAGTISGVAGRRFSGGEGGVCDGNGVRRGRERALAANAAVT